MDGVNRYAFFAYIDGGDNAEFDYHIESDGSWVKASDYDQLKAENERLERKNANQEEFIKQYQDQIDGGDLSLGMLITERDTLHAQLDEARELLNLALSRDVGGSVRGIIDAWLEATKP